MATSPNYGWLEPDNTDLVKNGALAIRTLGNAIDTTMATMTPKSTVTTKGDLVAATAASTPARLAVGNNGETLVADSSTSTGLRYTATYAAGKNKIINGAFDVWQRGTSFANPANFSYFADRFYSVSNNSGGTVTLSRQTFTGTDIPVAGAQYYFRSVGASPTGAAYNVFGQRIENVQTFAGQTVTISFYAKADTPRNVTPNLYQNFGSGGSTEVQTTGSAISLTTSWARYSQTFTVPSISGKTIGTSSFLAFEISQPVNVSHTLEYYGVQLEAGSVATSFQTATGTIQGELAACQRYFIRIGGNKIYEVMGLGYTDSTTETYASRTLPVTMRTTPSTTFAAANLFRTNQGGGSVATGTGIGQDGNASSPNLVNFYLQYSATGAASRGAAIQANNSTSATMDISAEL
jgi:hypothetical protein